MLVMREKMLFWHVLISMFLMLQTDAIYLRLVPRSKHFMQRKVAANFPFDPPIQVEVVNKESHKRITTGVYASLNISAVLTNSSGCLSNDADFQLQSGIGTFPGSICSVISQVAINFTASWNGTAFWSDSTPLLDVTGEIHIAHFHNQLTENSKDLSAFVFGSVADINEGITKQDSGLKPLLPGRVIYIRNYIHSGTEDGAVDAYLEMKRNFELDPASKAHAILGFGSNDAANILLPVAMLDDFSVLSYTEDNLTKFSDNDIYPFFNRLVYSEKSVYHGFVVYLLERNWKDIILIQSSDAVLGLEFFNMCIAHKINVLYEIMVTAVVDFNSEPAGKLKDQFAKIHAAGTRIIVTAAKKPTSFYLFAEALSQNVTATNGYQWVGLGTEDDFPHGNEPARCQNMNKLCNFAFKGTVFVSPFHLINGYSRPQWSNIWKRYLEIDQFQEKETAVELWKHGSSFALAYDSIQLYAAAIGNIIQANRTITGPLLSLTVRSIRNNHGLLESSTFSVTGDLMKFAARVSSVWPNKDIWKTFFSEKVVAGVLEPWDWSLARKYSNPTIGYFTVDSLESNSTTEVKSDGGSNILYTVDWLKDESLKTGYIDVNSKYKNLRRYRSANGLFSLDEQKLVTQSWSFEKRESRSDMTFEEVERTEYVPAPYFCVKGCGGNQTNPEDIRIYERGICSRQDVCTCSKDINGSAMWTGESCEIPVCNAGCFNGYCTSPDVCDCFPGWTGSGCQTPLCGNSSACDAVGGICIRPNECICKSNFYGQFCSKRCLCENGKCRNGQSGDGSCIYCASGYFGRNCDTSLYAVIFPVLLGVALFIIMVLSAINCFIRRSQLKAELQNNDWIVSWSHLKRSGEKTSKNMFVTRISLDETRREKKSNIGTWKRIDVYYQRFDRPSLKLNDSLRYEIKIVRDMKHENIVQFVGACIHSPNVLVLTELAAKGSLDDVLANEDIQIPWIFKYSLLKDICRGLEYIHQSEIGSHGRLKSSNCLIDSKWTLKLSGFGLRCFREQQTHIPTFVQGQEVPMKQELGDHAEYDFFCLFWTAPEFLMTGVHHLDHVGCGTTEGDIYSFAIIFSEIANRQLPFSNINMSNSEIIHMIAERHTPSLQRIWNTYLASMNMEAGGPVRPCIPKSNWPLEKEQNKPLQLLINRCWTKDPSLRPIAKDVLKTLEKIDPNSGENVEKLVLMLEKYSNNLEDVVTARAQALAEERRKTEELVARLLPRPVIEDLKLGKPVEAEKFDCVSICFSDLYDFSVIANGSTAVQVITLLNRVYTCFDSILVNFDAFRIETIGNTYMVVSGLPVRNGKKHASEIALFSLSLIDAVKNFDIDHLPNERLQIRIGIHSGGVAAGVVGLKIPRYCIFGETVNIASTLESTGKPMKILVSDATIDLIENSKQFDFEYNQHQDFQDNGLLKTWWLNGAKEMRSISQKEEKDYSNDE